MDLVRFASKNRETTDISSNQHERGQTHNAHPHIHPWYFKHTGKKDMFKHTEIYFLAYIFFVDIYNPETDFRCHYTKSNPIDDHSNISSKKLQKQNFKLLGHYTCMQCGTSHLQKVQENILSRIILATYRKFTVATVRFTQNVSCNIFTHPIYQQVANVTV